MIKLTQEQILMLHSEIISATGGTYGVRDLGLLSSALNAHFNNLIIPTCFQLYSRKPQD